MTILTRLGNVVYWLGVVCAGIFTLAGYSMIRDGSDAIYVVLGLALASYAAGWVVRYVLSGNTNP